MIERVEFAEVPSTFVDSRAVRLAVAVCKIVARDLGLGSVEVRWLAPAWNGCSTRREGARFWSEDDFRGMVRSGWPGVIFLRADLSLRGVVEVVAHECKHLAQAQAYGSWAGWWADCKGDHHRADQEADATAFARQVARDLGW